MALHPGHLGYSNFLSLLGGFLHLVKLLSEEFKPIVAILFATWLPSLRMWLMLITHSFSS